ncbi:hypothetical protein KKB18_12445, partial [bacterium]|nr:hypothetical protein [bacterium]
LPIAKDMPGRIMTEVIDPSFLHENPIRTIESYGSFKLVPAEEENKEINDQMKGYLKALGYIK